MSNFLEYLRQQNIFGPRPPMMGNDLPQQGGITGRMPYNPMMNDMSGGMQNPGINATPPPQFGMPGIQAPDMARKDPWEVDFGPTSMSPTGNIEDTSSGMPTPGQGMYVPPEQDAGERMRELYQPNTESTDRFNQMINQYPQEENPSWLRRIGAMVMDYTKGSKAGQDYYREPFNRKRDEWKDKIGPAQQAANLERYENVNQRTLAYNQMSTELREKALLAKEKNDEARTKILQQRADIYAFRANNPNLKIIIPKGGNVQAFNPLTGETHDTGIPSGSMTELDKIQMQGDQRMEQIGETGAQARETEGVRQAGRETLVGMRGDEARKTRATPSGGVTGRTELPTQYRVGIINAASRLRNSRPDLAKFIKIGSPGVNDIDIAKPGQNMFGKPTGPSPDQYNEIINTIYGKGATSKPPGPMGSHGPTSPTTGTIRVQLPDGSTHRFKGTPEEAEAAGYTVIGQ